MPQRHTKLAALPRKRPFTTHYFTARSKPNEWARMGHAATLHGALRAAVRHLLEGKVVSATVRGESGEVLTYAYRDRTLIRVVGML